ncbi:uncharacterized protein LOC112089788 [Eutrema salsugineum]|uniref:uncharacterized protein LOC112089788 n=1 Tax=Eutrema salsugineum TaxID=72664 RepID=UPI000CECFDB1|nr:uncharacterized protein LOC112089788 [Eutrema salsugineum]
MRKDWNTKFGGSSKVFASGNSKQIKSGVARVFTMIDPRKPLPEAVNIQFDSENIRRVLVSSPWMPSVCQHCKEVGHSLKHYKFAPIKCLKCKATAHDNESCPKLKPPGSKDPKSRRGRAKSHDVNMENKNMSVAKYSMEVMRFSESSLGMSKLEDNEESSEVVHNKSKVSADTDAVESALSDVELDSYDIDSGDSQSPDEPQMSQGFQQVVSKKKKKSSRGKGPNLA